MAIKEKAAELAETVSAESKIVSMEQKKSDRIREICGRQSLVICEMNINWLQSVLYEMEGARQWSPKAFAKLKDLWKEPSVWPHLGSVETIHLKDQLRSSRFELQRIENKMYDSNRPQLRKLSLKLEEEQERYRQLEQAQRAVDFWEDLYLMFMEDKERRRNAWMDERFYQMERCDIRKKMESCSKYCSRILETVEQNLLFTDRKLVESLNGVPKEIHEEIVYYAAGVLFLENHIYNSAQAAERRDMAAWELKRIEKGLQGEGAADCSTESSRKTP